MITDFEIKINLQKAKMDAKPIDALINYSDTVLKELLNSNTARIVFWTNFLRGIHPLLDKYLKTKELTKDFSDAVSEYVLSPIGETHTVDPKYYYLDNNAIQPYPVRNTYKNKIPQEQLKAIEKAYIQLNKQYGKILSVFFIEENTKLWVTNRTAAHQAYNTQDLFGLKIKIDIQDLLLKQLIERYGKLTETLDNLYPLKESIIISDDHIILKAESKYLYSDIFGNKIINMPEIVDNKALEPINPLNTAST